MNTIEDMLKQKGFVALCCQPRQNIGALIMHCVTMIQDTKAESVSIAIVPVNLVMDGARLPFKETDEFAIYLKGVEFEKKPVLVDTGRIHYDLAYEGIKMMPYFPDYITRNRLKLKGLRGKCLIPTTDLPKSLLKLWLKVRSGDKEFPILLPSEVLETEYDESGKFVHLFVQDKKTSD